VVTNKRFYNDLSLFDNDPLVKFYKLTIEYLDGSAAEFVSLPYDEVEKIISHEKEDEMRGYSIDVITRVKKR
jgi:hypothetical protein